MVRRSCTRWLIASALCPWSLAIAGCSVSSEERPATAVSTGGASSTGARGNSGGQTPTAAGGNTVNVVVTPPSTTPDGAPLCTPTTCNPPGAQYCGVIGDGCGKTLTCPACTGDWSCQDSVCVGGSSCAPISCQSGTARFCGSIGDGCGRALDCGACPTGETCTGSVCVAAGCVPLTCDVPGGRFCGTIGDGCGKTLECGSCPNGGICGGGNIANVCFDPNCTKTGCSTANGGSYCSTIGDGCGGVVECGACPGDGTCQDHQCIGGPSCTPRTCQSGTSKFCGNFGDGCGRTLTCSCAADESCDQGVCVKTGCVPLTCDFPGGRLCGLIGDGCGRPLDCSTCPSGGICGGGGINHLCFDPTCAQYSCQAGVNCGTIGDGCGGAKDCGLCQGDWTCQNRMCVGGPSCTRRTCQSGTTTFCGTFDDGCGGTLTCASCAADEACKGGVCVKTNCSPITACDHAGGRYCGTIGDGCGGTLVCGDCPSGQNCGGGGIQNSCFDPNCVPKTCIADNGGVYCGTIGDGCGRTLACSTTCPNSGVCGANDQPNICPGTGTGCTGLQCQVRDDCPNSGTTSLSGTVYDPAGVNPIYNALVYVPNAALDPVPTGASCDRCSATASGQPITTALTDVNGRFTLNNVPGGANIPLVIQVGKWRRQVTITSVTDCTDNPVTDKNLTRLPRNKNEGNIPRIAVTTGSADAVECLLRRIGIDDSEFTTDSGTGRVHLYYGGDLSAPDGDGAGANKFDTTLNGGAAFPSAATLWGNPTKMSSYDIQMYSCEGGQYSSAKEPYRANIESYMNAGGRVFLSHLHFNWLNHGSDDLQGTAEYIGVGEDLPEPSTGIVNTAFPRGNALADWLVAVGATPTRGELTIYQGQHSVSAVIAPTQDWITVAHNPNQDDLPSVQYMTFNTPVTVAEEQKCGRVVLTDLHINVSVGDTGGDDSDPSKPFPTACKTNVMSPQGKALEFVFFDLSACVQPPNEVPVPPPPPPVPPSNPPPPSSVPPAPPSAPPSPATPPPTAATAPPPPPSAPPPPTDPPPPSQTPPPPPPPLAPPPPPPVE